MMHLTCTYAPHKDTDAHAHTHNCTYLTGSFPYDEFPVPDMCLKRANNNSHVTDSKQRKHHGFNKQQTKIGNVSVKVKTIGVGMYHS